MVLASGFGAQHPLHRRGHLKQHFPPSLAVSENKYLNLSQVCPENDLIQIHVLFPKIKVF